MVLTVGGQGDDIGGHLQHQARRRVEEVAAEVEDQSGEDEHHPPLIAVVAYHIGDPLIEEGGFVDDEGTHRRVGFDHLLKGKGVADLGDVLPTLDIPSAIGERIIRVVHKACPVDLTAYEEDLAPVHLPA